MGCTGRGQWLVLSARVSSSPGAEHRGGENGLLFDVVVPLRWLGFLGPGSPQTMQTTFLFQPAASRHQMQQETVRLDNKKDFPAGERENLLSWNCHSIEWAALGCSELSRVANGRGKDLGQRGEMEKVQFGW